LYQSVCTLEAKSLLDEKRKNADDPEMRADVQEKLLLRNEAVTGEST
jgi:trans-2-enoyl-CoA reductase